MTADALRRHPDYHEGFFSANDGRPLPDDASDAFRAGWEAWHRNAKIFAEAGFEQGADGMFTKSFRVKP